MVYQDSCIVASIKEVVAAMGELPLCMNLCRYPRQGPTTADKQLSKPDHYTSTLEHIKARV